MGAPPGEVTALLARANAGDGEALSRVAPLVYQELRRLAAHQMRGERASHTLQPTALVHEAWLRLIGQDRAAWQNRGQFMAIASRMMRRILVDHARRRRAGKRELPAVVARMAPARVDEILAVDEALGRLESLDPRQARIFEMRYFGGLSVDEAAEAEGVSTATVRRDCTLAKAWLRNELERTP